IKKVALAYGSPDLLIAYLLSENVASERSYFIDKYRSQHTTTTDNLPYDKIIEAIQNGEIVTDELLPANNFYFLHALILLNPNGSKFITKEYLTKLSKNWYLNFRTEGLEASLYHTAYFRALFVL